jgi:hypothetical protein
MSLLRLVVESIHQVHRLKQNCLVIDVQLRADLEEPVDHGCAQLTSDIWLVGHQSIELLLVLARCHVVKLFASIAF